MNGTGNGWSRERLARLAWLQREIQLLVRETGVYAQGADELIAANEDLAQAETLALAEVEHHEDARAFTAAIAELAETGK